MIVRTVKIIIESSIEIRQKVELEVYKIIAKYNSNLKDKQ